MDLLTYKDVTLGYGRRAIIEDVSFNVAEGEFLGIVGPNGAGKSTLIKSMLGLLKPQWGSIVWNKKVPARGYVPQREQVDPLWPMRVRDMLQLTLNSLGSPFTRNFKEDPRVLEEMEIIGITHLANQTLDTLSGGQLQRVLLARALIIEPEVLILDEPTAAMDLVAAEKFLSLITEIHEKRKMTVIIVTHDLPSLVGRAHTLGIIQNGRVHFGSSDSLLTSEKLSSIYQVPLKVTKVDGQTVILQERREKGVE